MPQSTTFESFHAWLSAWFLSKVTNKFGKVVAYKVIFFVLLVYFLTFYIFNFLYSYLIMNLLIIEFTQKGQHEFSYYPFLKIQSKNPLVFLKAGHLGHEAKMIFRLIVPTLLKFLNIFKKDNIIGLYSVQFALGLFHLVFFWKIISRIVVDELTKYFLTLAYIGLYAGSAFVIDVFGYGDGFSFFFIMAAIYFRANLFSFLFLELGFWNDERVMVNSLLIWICWVLLKYNDFENLPTKQVIRYAAKTLGYLAITWLIYFTGRFYLIYVLKFETDVEGSISIALSSFNQAYFKVFPVFEGFWFIIALATLQLILKKQYIPLIIISLCFALGFSISFMITDNIRSIAFTFPIIIISLVILKNYINSPEFKKMVIILAILNLVIPIFLP